MGSDKRKRPTKSLNDDFDDARTGRRGSAKAVKRERASAGSARGRAPQPAAEIEVDDAPIEIDDDDDVFPDEDPDPVATVRPRDIPPNPPSGPDTPRHPSLLVVVSGGANLPRGGTRRAPDHPPPNPPNSRRLSSTCRSSRASRRSLTCRSSPRRYARAGPVQPDDQPDPISKPKYGHPRLTLSPSPPSTGETQARLRGDAVHALLAVPRRGARAEAEALGAPLQGGARAQAR